MIAEHPDLVEVLESETAAAIKATSRPAGIDLGTTSLVVASRADDPGNPEHREDFTALLNAAAKTKPQDDQT